MLDLDLDVLSEDMGVTNPVREQLLGVEELAAIQPPEPLIGDVLSQGSLAVLYGRWATFKSFIALDWAMCVGGGYPWQSREVRGGPVIYVVAEGVRGMAKRAQAWLQHYGVDSVPEVFFHPGAIDLTKGKQVDHLVETTNKLDAKLVIIDTLNRSLSGGDENSSSAMGLAIASASAIQNAANTTVLLIHHTGKDGTLRGHSSLPGAADHVIKTWVPEGDNDGFVMLYSNKVKDDEPFDPIRLRFKQVKLEHDTSGVITNPGGWQ